MPSFPDTAFLVILALLLFGPKKLPVLARQLGKLMADFRRASNEFRTQMEEELRLSEDADRRKKEEERLRALAAAPLMAQPPIEAAADIGAVESVAPPPPAQQISAPIEETADSLPRILPPSTGEPVAASRPHAQPEQPLAPSIEEIAAAARAQAQSETVNQNG